MQARGARAACLAVAIGVLAADTAAAADKWIEVRSEHFTVVSNAGEGRTRQIAWQFEQMRSAIGRAFPWAQVDLNRPVLVLAVSDEDDMRHMAPQFWETRGLTHPGSVFVSTADRHYILLRADIEVEQQGMNPHNAAYWSYSGLVLNAGFGHRLPLWLTNGMSAVLSNTIVHEKEIQFGLPIPWHVQRLEREPRLRLADLFEVTRDSSYYRQAATRSRFEAQSWGLVQFMMFGGQSDVTTRINQLTELLFGGASSGEAVARVYGDLDELDEAYQLYLHQKFFKFARLMVDTDTSMAKYPVREVDASESAALRASFHVAMDRPEEARALIAEARKANPAQPIADEAEAMLFARAGDRDAERAAWARAVANDSADFWAYYRLADLSRTGPLDDAARDELAGLLERATTLNPAFAPALNRLADLQAQQRHFDAALTTAQKAVEVEPSEVAHRILVARLLQVVGRDEEAAVVARAALPLAATDQQRAILQQLLRPSSPATP